VNELKMLELEQKQQVEGQGQGEQAAGEAVQRESKETKKTI
jgi:hypothetical protein